MKLLHVSHLMYRDSILEQGLKTGQEKANEKAAHSPKELAKIKKIEKIRQRDFDRILYLNKPSNLPEWMRMDNCVFFWLPDDYRKHLQDEYGPPHRLPNFSVFVHSRHLNKDRLFALNNDTAVIHRVLSDIVSINQYYARVNSGRRAGKNPAKYFKNLKESAALFWTNLVPFSDYMLSPGRYPKVDTWPYCREILYFDDVSKDLLTKVTASNYLHGALEETLELMRRASGEKEQG